MLGFAGELKGFIFMNLDLVRDDVFGLFDVLGSQELLGACATRSAFSVVVPVDVDGHWDPLRLCGASMALCACWVPGQCSNFSLAV